MFQVSQILRYQPTVPKPVVFFSSLATGNESGALAAAGAFAPNHGEAWADELPNDLFVVTPLAFFLWREFYILSWSFPQISWCFFWDKAASNICQKAVQLWSLPKHQKKNICQKHGSPNRGSNIQIPRPAPRLCCCYMHAPKDPSRRSWVSWSTKRDARLLTIQMLLHKLWCKR